MAKLIPRPAIPKRMRLTNRDKEILSAIYDFEGLMSRAQLAKLFFNGGEPGAKKRLRKLFENGYIRQPDERDLHRVPVGTWLYWLDHDGLDIVAGLKGDEPLYTDKVRTQSPQWAKVEHDLALNDVRLTMLDAIAAHPELQLGEYVNEKILTHRADEVTFSQANGRQTKKRFAADGFFTVYRTHEERKITLAYLLEIDMGTHSNPAFQDEKVRPGVAYLTSEVYQARFGIKFGRFLVVTTSDVRLENLLKQASRVEGGQLFYFTTFKKLTPQTFFTEPIWRSSGKEVPFALVSP